MNAPPRIVIEAPAPAVDGGRYAPKRCVGDDVTVSADIFRDGHDRLGAAVRFRRVGTDPWGEAPLTPVDAHHDGVRWAGHFSVDAVGDWEYMIDAWVDPVATWQQELTRKREAGQSDLRGELSEGERLLGITIDADAPDWAALLDPATIPDGPARRTGGASLGPLPLRVDRIRARYGSWYELFPRSWGGLAGVRAQLPAFAELGFDVLYLPPIHPIGLTNRKGANNTLQAAPGDPGSPWAIGDATGGHEAVHPELGTVADLRALSTAAAELGMEVALDFAIQCSADHPWLTEHPEWFHRRPDGSLKYAENPPKKYQDIYNVNWDTTEWEALWAALLEIVLGWVDCGVKIFRVDNPHTKPAAFWAWLIAEVHNRDQDVIFLAEAFTRRRVMQHLAKVGFSQSYTYFTWRNAKWELTEYLTELAHGPEREYFRPNFFANTPDILHASLQHGGLPAFAARLVLAATLSPSYGIYSGFENAENVAVAEGSEEYLHSEKYEIKPRRLEGPLLGLIGRLNHARAANPALQRLDNLTFLETENDQLIAYAKQTGTNTVICIVNLDPHHRQEGLCVVPAELGTAPVFGVADVVGATHFQWRIGRNYVALEPGDAHVAVLER
ncbi:alpha-1,4-glucan--maltose-1-phosphate maltosyltransferase [Conexibacter sp. DBS9H8]|uniref:alpha-1,4-glucan--maltose-1-phosphate maltosyltransferase n=1 Tax=Conexibacter sp. DBS9H8 TaxID=2937801 RepID=UPI00200C4B23|nr:alpha-1,4-glucan--maltose-1-phosphate maltosyltransferase [Conexibacter sp. DBS9H8]